MKSKLLDIFPHYWICGVCAKERGGVWPKGHVATIAQKKCEYCNGKNHTSEDFIAPWVDYNWEDARVTAYAKSARD
jgi:hypothetical protein